MRWWSILRSRSGSGWMPVSNMDDHGETGMDDLMRMAMGQYQEEETGGCSGEGIINGNNIQENHHDDMAEPVFHHAQRLPHGSPSCLSSLQSSSSSVSPSQLSSSSSSSHQRASDPEVVSKVSCFCGLRKPAFPKVKWYLVLLSIFVTISFIGLNVGLGCYSLIVYNPDELVIDKSVKSFSIPNHEAYRNFEAMMLARKDNSSTGRYRRDTRTATDAGSHLKRSAALAKENEMLRQTESMLQNLRKEHTGFRRKKKSIQSPSLWSFFSGSNEASSKSYSIGSTFTDLFQRVKRSSHEIGCLLEYQSIARWKMHVIYLAHGDNNTNMFTKERLQTAHEIERKIIEHPGFHDFCLRDPNIQKYDPATRDMKGCVPLNSLLTYFYPSKDSEGNVFYDGLGTNIDDIDSALKLAMNYETFYYYVDEKINKTFQKSHLLRSEVLFGAPLPGFPCVGDQKKDQDDKFKDFVVTYIDLLSKSSTDKVRVLYGGNEIFDYEVTTSFWSDVRLAIISLIAIFILMLVLSLSIYLTFVGVIVIALSFPISLFFYRVVFGINALGILNGAAAFVIIGIGVDDVFVFVNIYRQASHMKDPVKRIGYTVKTAGVATFFTSFTTAAAFAANIASSIPAVYEFGLFMSLIVSSCWISVFCLMPPMLYLHACCFEPIEKAIFSCFSCVGSKEESHFDASVQHYSQQQVSDRRLYEDDDVPMLDMEEVEVSPNGNIMEDYEGMDDDNMLLIDDPYLATEGQGQTRTVEDVDAPLLPAVDVSTTNTNDDDVSHGDDGSSSNNNNNMCLGRLMQKMIMFLTNRIVIRGRYIVMGTYAVLLIVSCCLMVQLQPSTHPPQLFRPDTNIQQLLDLKANFSIIDTLHCDQCSGLYKVKPTSAETQETQYQHPITASPPLPPHNTPAASQDQHSGPRTSPATPTDNKDGGLKLDTTTDGSVDGDANSLSRKLSELGEQTESVPMKMLTMTLSKLLSSLSSHSSSSSSPSPALNSTQEQNNKEIPHQQQRATTARTWTVREPATAPPPPLTLPPPTPPPSSSQQHQQVDPGQSYAEDHPGSRTPSHQNSNSGSLTPSKSSSVDENFNACKGQSCNDLKDRPIMESGATVYVVFGITGVDRSGEDEGHVLDQFKGKATFDSKFAESFNLRTLDKDLEHLRELCKICHFLSNQTDLVKPDSAQCLPSGMHALHAVLNMIEECRDLPDSLVIYHRQAPAHAEGGIDREGRLLWLAFAFESTTSEGQAYFEAYKQYEKWEKLMTHIKENILSHDSPLRSMFQTSEFWTKVLMEVVAVNSAIYGLVLSMLICVMAVAVFTGQFVLLLIVVLTIVGMICCVVGIFYLAGWEMGAVEAVSLSILVGSSVDYCVHIVEGYILAGRRMPIQYLNNQPAKALRQQRTSLAVRHIGVAIVCSALTTIIAAVPLTQTYIQPFAKFGSILLINTTVSMVMTLTLAVAMLATFGPARYRGTWKSHLIAFAVVVVITGVVFLGLYIAATHGVNIPGPSGNPLFS